MEINYFIKNVYGGELMYISDKTIANAVGRLTNKHTIDESDIAALEALGHTVTHVPIN